MTTSSCMCLVCQTLAGIPTSAPNATLRALYAGMPKLVKEILAAAQRVKAGDPRKGDQVLLMEAALDCTGEVSDWTARQLH